jgi:hypothetical protein
MCLNEWMNACMHAASNTWSLTQSESTKSIITSGKLIRLAFDLDLFAVVESHYHLSQNWKESFIVKSWWLPSADYSHGSDAHLCYEGYGVVVMVACHCKLAMEGDGLALWEWLSLRLNGCTHCSVIFKVFLCRSLCNLSRINVIFFNDFKSDTFCPGREG